MLDTGPTSAPALWMFDAGCVGCLCAGLTCLLAWNTARRVSNPQASRVTWLTLATFLFAGAIVVSVDAPWHFAEAFRQWFEFHGWYENRRPLQALIIGILALAGVAALVWTNLKLRARGRCVRLGAALLTLLVALVAIESISLHHVDSVMEAQVGGLTVFEACAAILLAGITCCAAMRIRIRGLDLESATPSDVVAAAVPGVESVEPAPVLRLVQ